MTNIILPEKEWGEPLEKLQRRIAKLQGPKASFLSVAIADCVRFYEFLAAIWRRLSKDYDFYNSYMSIVKKRMEGIRKGPFLDPEEDSVLLKHMQETVYLSIDYYDFLIYSKILLDKFAYMAQLLTKTNLPYRFHKQKDFLLKRENIPFKPDEEYAEYIRKETNWFDRNLKLSRDELIVHSLPFMGGIKSSPNGDLTLLRIGWGRDVHRSWEKLKTLKTKYENKYPELKTVNENIYEITKFLIDTPEIELDPDDKTVFLECLRDAGSELPDISLLADKIIEFTIFFGKHFEKHIAQY